MVRAIANLKVAAADLEGFLDAAGPQQGGHRALPVFAWWRCATPRRAEKSVLWPDHNLNLRVARDPLVILASESVILVRF